MKVVFNLVLPILALIGLVVGNYIALFVMPPESAMGDVYRILFIHVPAAWIAILACTITFISSIFYLLKSNWKADALAEAGAEVGIFFGVLLIVLGAIWAKPTWGVWWTWDPRLTTAAILIFAFIGYMVLRHSVENPEKRAAWSAVVAIIIYADVPILWFSVRWWRSLHQIQSNTQTMDGAIVKGLVFNSIVFLLLCLWFIHLRYKIARRRRQDELSEPPPKFLQGAQNE